MANNIFNVNATVPTQLKILGPWCPRIIAFIFLLVS
jgi:hypothetical protein